ncbi:mediator of RNA polymerase II transcription subunit 30-like [Dreissena polymorpha]|uniref:Mediator of RNA polymerase II transcription subunit 30 n=1 Tax=Dreissena polymorpha TaxID=45954 RepID=A0A9D4FW19_DREPO|nr:mediator of RNA polymerase II transcription subunit 30-like [Dreissena polymorpha]XP_052215303.1 mediator of RNA polymerase II transcription subunit 30-like [Dreissena polymorpha]KAH3806065.1 hypothetical protein DPMN_134379 [Dreissena polymorpha]
MAGSGQHFPMNVSNTLSGDIISVQGPILGSGYSHSPGSAPSVDTSSMSQATFSSNTSQPQMMSPTKPFPNINLVQLCKGGQETNQEILNKLLDLFRHFKMLQLPNGTANQNCMERKTKVEEILMLLKKLFQRLRFMYDRANQMIPDPDDNPEEVLVPLKGDPLSEKNTNTDIYRAASEEHRQLVEQIQQKNRQIKEIIDKIRTIMWEINTMIVMRKT